MDRIGRIRPTYRDPETWSMFYDNTPSHTWNILLRIVRISKKKLLTFSIYLNFFLRHLFINLIDAYIGICEGKFIFERHIKLNF